MKKELKCIIHHSGAGIAGGMGGAVILLLEAGFIDAICSTGARGYHDLHFAFDFAAAKLIYKLIGFKYFM